LLSAVVEEAHSSLASQLRLGRGRRGGGAGGERALPEGEDKAELLSESLSFVLSG
jgi:hypothetical protein